MLSKPSWYFFIEEYPRQTLTMLGFLLVAGIVESIGAVSLVPLLAVMFGGATGATPALARAEGLFRSIGLSPTLGHMLLVICCAISLKAILTLLAFRQTGNVEASISTQLRADLLDNLFKARWSYFVAQPAGELSFALSTEASQAGVALRSFCQTLSHLTQSLTYLLAGLFISWPTMLAALLSSALFAAVFRKLVQTVRTIGTHQCVAVNTMAALFTDALAGAKPLKSMGAEESFARHIKRQSEQYKLMSRKSAFTGGLLAALQEPALTLSLGLGIYVAATRLQMDGATLLATAVFFQRIVSRAASAQQCYQQYAALEGILLSLRKKIRVIREHADLQHGTAEVVFRKAIRFSGVGVSHGDVPVLSGLDMVLPFGTITALCGPSGSGKTTVADLLTGLIQPDSGQITVDDVPLPMIRTECWRQQIGYVPQEVFLFNDTIRNNINVGRDYPDERIWDALDRAGARSFVETLKDGLDSMVGEQGRALSGGQRQRLMIARALTAKPSLLILDEATTGLDLPTEKDILGKIVQLKGDMTVLAISHQPAVRDICDQFIAF